jgi:hypothetical protein
MTTHRDVSDAHTFHRRRLTSALVSGATGRGDPPPGRAARSVVWGLVLTGLLLGGAVAVGHLSGRQVVTWDQHPHLFAARR